MDALILAIHDGQLLLLVCCIMVPILLAAIPGLIGDMHKLGFEFWEVIVLDLGLAAGVLGFYGWAAGWWG